MLQRQLCLGYVSRKKKYAYNNAPCHNSLLIKFGHAYLPIHLGNRISCNRRIVLGIRIIQRGLRRKILQIGKINVHKPLEHL